MNLNQLNHKQYENISQYINQPFGSMPRADNSLRIILLIQADTEASPSLATASFMAFSSCGSTLKAICLLPFVLKVVDMGLSPYYSLSSVNQLYCNRHQKSMRLKSVVTTNKPLTSNLTKDKTMANPNYTGSSEPMECFTLNSGKTDKFQKCDQNHFTKCGQIDYSFLAVAKSAAEPENSNHLSTAQNTPNACFFMRSARTPKECLALLESQERPSMVACSGKGFALCCVPLIAVSQPVTRYRPSLRTLAATSNQFINGVTQMYQFIFAGIRRTDLTNRIQKIRINAESELQARAILAREFVLVLVGRINLKNLSNFDRTLTGVIYA